MMSLFPHGKKISIIPWATDALQVFFDAPNPAQAPIPVEATHDASMGRFVYLPIHENHRLNPAELDHKWIGKYTIVSPMDGMGNFCDKHLCQEIS